MTTASYIREAENSNARLRGERSCAPIRITLEDKTRRPSVADWFNPRRKMQAERLITFLCWHGRKVRLDERALSEISDVHHLDSVAVRQAADDLYHLGLVEMRMHHDTMILTLLSTELP